MKPYADYALTSLLLQQDLTSLIGELPEGISVEKCGFSIVIKDHNKGSVHILPSPDSYRAYEHTVASVIIVIKEIQEKRNG